MTKGARRPWAAEGAVGSRWLPCPMGHPAGNASLGDTQTCSCLLCRAACEQRRSQEQPPAPRTAPSPLCHPPCPAATSHGWRVQLPDWLLPQQLGHPMSLERGCCLVNRCT